MLSHRFGPALLFLATAQIATSCASSTEPSRDDLRPSHRSVYSRTHSFSGYAAIEASDYHSWGQANATSRLCSNPPSPCDRWLSLRLRRLIHRAARA
jgi:hypothetical protein